MNPVQICRRTGASVAAAAAPAACHTWLAAGTATRRFVKQDISGASSRCWLDSFGCGAGGHAAGRGGGSAARGGVGGGGAGAGGGAVALQVAAARARQQQLLAALQAELALGRRGGEGGRLPVRLRFPANTPFPLLNGRSSISTRTWRIVWSATE